MDFLRARDFCFPGGRSLERVLLRRAALFLWMTCLLAARSTVEIAVKIFFLVLSLLAILIAALRLVRTRLLTTSFLFDAARARLAVLVTGMFPSIISQG